eukprot:4420680-Pleurochrysis_carterae.AAC.2
MFENYASIESGRPVGFICTEVLIRQSYQILKSGHENSLNALTHSGALYKNMWTRFLKADQMLARLRKCGRGSGG